MNIEELREYCLSFPSATEKMPWIGDRMHGGGLCFYVGEKWFCFTDVDDFRFVNIKLPAERNEELRMRYHGVCPGWHMNKKYWSSVYFGEDVSDDVIRGLIKESYDTVLACLSKKVRETIMERFTKFTAEIK